MRTDDFVGFIVKREAARLAKEKGLSVELDPVIAQYRFCNVRRNDDRVTKWIHKNLMEPLSEDENLWFHLVIARLFNNPQTLAAFPLPEFISWRPEQWRKRLVHMKMRGDTIFNAAYIVSTNGRRMDKIDYLIDEVLTPLWKARKLISQLITEAKTLNEVHATLMSAQGLGSFMAAQVVADLKYAYPKARWKDFHTFAASGPGSRRGLNRVLGGPIATARTEEDFREKLALLRDATNAKLKTLPGMKYLVPITAQDIQNCLCEFDKYERARLGEGRPKQRYTPAESPPWKEK